MLQRNQIKSIKAILLASVVCVSVASIGSVYAQAKNKPKSNPPSTEGLSAQDKLFVELREAARANDASKANQLAAKLEQYDLHDYVSYFQIKPRLFDKGGQAKADSGADYLVEAFLKVNAGSAIADRMRNDWLLVLGKRKDWALFDREYAQFVLDDDTQVKCYALQSRLVKGESAKQLGKELQRVMLDAQYFGEACPETAQAIYQDNGLSRAELRALGRIALEANYEGLAKRISGDDPIADLVKKARTEPVVMYREFDKKSWVYAKENAAAAWGVIGQYLAKRLDRNAIDAFRKQHELGFHHLLSPETQEWKVRAALREGDWKLVKESIDQMNTVVRRRDPAWSYWYARAVRELGDEGLAKETFSILAEQFHFYGQLAREELGLPIMAPKRVAPEEDLVKKASAKKGFARAVRFYDMNLRFEGNREWNWELRNLSDRELIASAEYAKRISLYDRAVNTADRTKLEHDFTLRYPTPFKEALAPIAQQVGLDMNWAYGLIRQESRFIMNARSHVGASGLMQVMPKTAQYVAKKIGMNDFKISQLNDMRTNLTLGSHYLNMVMIDLDGSWALASAAYNAGPGRPKSWREKLSRPVEGAIFAETIPFNETRGYVKHVLANANYYAALATAKPQSIKAKLGTISPKAAVLTELP